MKGYPCSTFEGGGGGAIIPHSYRLFGILKFCGEYAGEGGHDNF